MKSFGGQTPPGGVDQSMSMPTAFRQPTEEEMAAEMLAKRLTESAGQLAGSGKLYTPKEMANKEAMEKQVIADLLARKKAEGEAGEWDVEVVEVG